MLSSDFIVLSKTDRPPAPLPYCFLRPNYQFSLSTTAFRDTFVPFQRRDSLDRRWILSRNDLWQTEAIPWKFLQWTFALHQSGDSMVPKDR